MVHSNLGASLMTMGLFEAAVASLNRALEIDPRKVEALTNLGCVLKDLGRFDESIRVTRQAIDADPRHTNAYSNLLFIFNYLGQESDDNLLGEARRFGRVVSGMARPTGEWVNHPDPQRKLRIGLVSGDLCMHPVGYFAESVLSALSSCGESRLELYSYPTRIVEDAISARLRQSCRGWHPVMGLSDEAFAKRVREDAIDILIDLSGHSAHNRLPVFGWKPAPVQVSWLGYFATTGVAEMDYLIADPWTLPESQEEHFTETIWRLPETRLCFTVPDEVVPVSLLPALSNHCVTFGCFNNLSKINDEVVALWSRILKAVPGSRLLLKCKQVEEPSIRAETTERFQAHGVQAERLVFETHAPRVAYLSAYHRVDIGLDPFPYPGGTTTVESLWMGVPVLTLAGERFLSRQGVGLLMNAGLPDWVAKDKEDYVAKAIKHAGDLPRLALLRSLLRQQVLASPIFDAERFAGHFEDALRGMWKKWCEKQV